MSHCNYRCYPRPLSIPVVTQFYFRLTQLSLLLIIETGIFIVVIIIPNIADTLFNITIVGYCYYYIVVGCGFNVRDNGDGDGDGIGDSAHAGSC